MCPSIRFAVPLLASFASPIAVSAAEEAQVPARLLVLSKAESKLAIVDPETMKVVARVPTGHAPHEVAVSADGRTAFVSDYGSSVPGSTLTVIDLAGARVTDTVDLSPLRRPHGIVEHGGKVYFTAEVNAAVGRYCPTEGRVDLVIGTGQAGSHMLAVDPADGRLYTTNLGSDTVTALDPQRGPGGGPLTAHTPVAGQPEGVALSPDGRQLWVAPRAGGPISIVETAGDTVKEIIPFDGVGIRLAFTPDGSRVLVSDARDHEVVVFDAKEKREIGTVKVGEVPVGLVVRPDGAAAYVSCTGAHKVVAIDLKEMKVAGELTDVGPQPDGIAWAAPRPAPPARRAGMFGAQLENIGAADAKRLGLPAPQGIVVVQPAPGGPAEKAGLKPNDVILTVNGAPVANVQRFVRMLGRAGAGDELAIDFLRDGQKQTLKVTLAPRPG